MPARGSGPVSASPSPITQHTSRSRVVERRAVGMRERVAQLATFVNGTRRLGSDVAGNSARE